MKLCRVSGESSSSIFNRDAALDIIEKLNKPLTIDEMYLVFILSPHSIFTDEALYRTFFCMVALVDVGPLPDDEESFAALRKSWLSAGLGFFSNTEDMRRFKCLFGSFVAQSLPTI